MLRTVKKKLKIGNIIGIILAITGIVLLIIGASQPPIIYSTGDEGESSDSILEKMFGGILLSSGAIVLISFNIGLRYAIKRGPQDFTAQIKNLYYNYLKCTDMSSTDKEFYKQKLEDIRYAELADAIHSAAVSTSAAIMFTTLRK